MARRGEPGEHLTQLNELREENAALKRENAVLRRQLAAAGQQRDQAESERRQWRAQAQHALTMDDREYIRDALEKLA